MKVLGLFAVGAVLWLQSCSFDEHANEAFGCDECAPPNRCFSGFCVPPSGSVPKDAATPMDASVDAGFDSGPPPVRVDAGDAGGAGTSGQDCTEGQVRPCYEGVEGTEHNLPCERGRSVCEDGAWSECRGQVLPKAERCNLIDDDCDGTSDEDFDYDAAECPTQTNACPDGGLPQAELCDGIDNDCDGDTDEIFDLDSDDEHCGSCEHSCNADDSCCSGNCVQQNDDPLNCGACGHACADDQTCCGGTCADTQNDFMHCGPSCSACSLGQACCDGACADLDSFLHCGRCETSCDQNTELCCDGVCTTDFETCGD